MADSAYFRRPQFGVRMRTGKTGIATKISTTV